MRGIAAGNAHHAAARVTTGAAQEQALDRSAILSGARHRAHHQESDRMPGRRDANGRRSMRNSRSMSAGVSTSAATMQLRRPGATRSSVSSAVSKKRCRPLVPAFLERIGRILHDGREHVLAGRRQARVVDAGHGDFHGRRCREFAVLRVVVRVLEVAEARAQSAVGRAAPPRRPAEMAACDSARDAAWRQDPWIEDDLRGARIRCQGAQCRAASRRSSSGRRSKSHCMP